MITVQTDVPYVTAMVPPALAGEEIVLEQLAPPQLLELMQKLRAKNFKFTFRFDLPVVATVIHSGRFYTVRVLCDGYDTGSVGWCHTGRNYAYTMHNDRLSAERRRGGPATTTKIGVAISTILRTYHAPSPEELRRKAQGGLQTVLKDRKFQTIWMQTSTPILERMVQFVAARPELMAEMNEAGVGVPDNISEIVAGAGFADAMRRAGDKAILVMRQPDGAYMELHTYLAGEGSNTYATTDLRPASHELVTACTMLSMAKDYIDWLGVCYGPRGDMFAILPQGLERVAQSV